MSVSATVRVGILGASGYTGAELLRLVAQHPNFELAVATAIALYGPGSGAALATVVGVLVEVPVMLSVCAFCNRTRDWFPAAPEEAA